MLPVFTLSLTRKQISQLFFDYYKLHYVAIAGQCGDMRYAKNRGLKQTIQVLKDGLLMDAKRFVKQYGVRIKPELLVDDFVKCN